MEFSIGAALVAGLAATAVMSVMMKMAGAAGMTDMPPMELVTGSMMSGDPGTAKRVGIMVHWVVMGTLVFGIGYALLFTLLGSASVGIGGLIGAAHGAVVGLVFMPMMPAMHPRMTTETLPDGTVSTAGGAISLTAPGVLGARWGSMTPVGLLMGHVMYGIIAALVYQALV
ncbi:MAG: hypothetical protein ACR2KP_12870 [Egibacteraceae bacterium]